MSPPDQSSLVLLAAFGCVEGIGRRTLRKLEKIRNEYGFDVQDLWVPTADIITKLSLTTKQIESIQKNDSDHINDSIQQALINDGVRLIGTESEEYPPLLRESDDPPPVLFVKGHSMEWGNGQIPVAVVGTRDMSAYGRVVTEKIATELADLGAVVVSGLMYGVDTAAHLSAIRTGGQTVAVLGYGFNHCYPAEHQPVFDSLLASGATYISEYPPWKKARKGNFPARNSIVAGMSAAVVVTEAAARSGSLITAQFALDEGRVVCAVPGPITNPYCEGTKWLINEGATLVSSGLEILEEIGGVETHSKTVGTSLELGGLSETGRQIVTALSNSSLSIDDLSQQLHIEPSILGSELSLLEINGVVSTVSNRVTLLK